MAREQRSVGRGKGYGVDVAPVPLVEQSSGLQRHRFVYQLHILNKFCQRKTTKSIKDVRKRSPAFMFLTFFFFFNKTDFLFLNIRCYYQDLHCNFFYYFVKKLLILVLLYFLPPPKKKPPKRRCPSTTSLQHMPGTHEQTVGGCGRPVPRLGREVATETRLPW